MLQPARTKYRKPRRGLIKKAGLATKGSTMSFGDFGLKSLELGWVSSRQIEAARKSITRYVARGGKMWIRVFPDIAYTKKPLEVPMGGGKGDVLMYVAPLKRGRILFEVAGITEAEAREAFRLASYKLPVKTKFVSVND